MKKIFSITAAAAALLSFASCQKEEHKNIDDNSTSTERIISGSFTSDGTRTALDADGKTPLWSAGDKIRVLSGTGYQDVTLVAGGSTPGTNEGVISADSRSFTFATTLTGSLYAVYPVSATSMTSCSDGSITFTVPAIQDGTFASSNICVASGDGASSIYFSNATAVVGMTVAGSVVGARFAAANNVAGNMTVAMGTKGTITGTTTSLSSSSISVSDINAPDGSRFYLAVAPVETGAVTVTCNTISKSGSTGKSTKELARDKIYVMDLSAMTIEDDFDLTGQHGILNGQEYVLIKAKYDGTNDSYLKWATQNLAVTESGKAKWMGTDYVIGDYFQWAASYGGYGLTEDDFKIPGNLVIYESFKNTCAGGESDSFSFKDGKSFAKLSSPYGGYSYSKYTSSDSKKTLELSDDVANIVLGGTWRIPTGGSGGHFTKMQAATYWAKDVADKGYYVFKPGVGTSGTAGGIGSIAGTDDRTKALLFFPAAGGSGGSTLKDVGVAGYYWSSTLCSGDDVYNLYFNESSVFPEINNCRYYGPSVRPVSD